MSTQLDRRAGTPYLAYRERVLRLGQSFFSPGDSYLWRARSEDQNLGGHAIFQLENLKSSNKESAHSLPPTLHLLLKTLCSDFYRSFDIIELFSKVYPESYFSFPSSNNRMHQNLFRLRHWLTETLPEVQISQEGSGFKLQPSFNRGILVQKQSIPHDLFGKRMARLKEIFGEQTFSSSEARAHLKLSYGTTHSLIEKALSQKLLKKLGRGPKVRYQV